MRAFRRPRCGSLTLSRCRRPHCRVIARELRRPTASAYHRPMEALPAYPRDPGAIPSPQGALAWIRKPGRSWHTDYLIAGALVAVMALFRWALGLALDDLAPTYILFLGAVTAASILTSGPATVAATIASMVVCQYFFVDPVRSFELEGRDVVLNSAFFVEGVLTALVGSRLRSALSSQVDRERQVHALYHKAHEGEVNIRKANTALQILADAGVTLNSSLDTDETLTAVAALMVPRFADVCAIDLVEEGELRRVASAYSTDELSGLYGPDSAYAQSSRKIRQAARDALRGGNSLFMPAVESPASAATPPGYATGQVAPRSLILIPIEARKQILGVLTFLRVGDRTPFDGDDLAMAQQMGRRAGLAVDNARLYSEARKANDAKDEFLGMMSHELRTPITVIQGGAHVLRSRGGTIDADTAEQIFADIERESQRLSRMLENLLTLARAELDGSLVIEPVLLQRLVPRIVGTLRSSSPNTINVQVTGEPPAVAGEAGYIEQVVRNLVSNAIKYSPPEGAIDVVVAAAEGGAEVCVQDRGFGVSPEEAERIFERFYRSGRTAKLAGGAGLGLAVSRRLVTAMSGEIWAVPREGGGLTVGFRLPAYRGDDGE